MSVHMIEFTEDDLKRYVNGLDKIGKIRILKLAMFFCGLKLEDLKTDKKDID